MAVLHRFYGIYIERSQVNHCLNVFLSLKISFDITQSAAFHVGIHCLSKYPFEKFVTASRQVFYAISIYVVLY